MTTSKLRKIGVNTQFALKLGSELSLYGQVLGGKNEELAAQFMKALPLAGEAIQDSWSGEVLRLGVTIDELELGDREPLFFMYPGLISVDVARKELVLCYGQGRLSDGRGPRPTLPVAELLTDLDDLGRWGVHADTRGAVPVSVADCDPISEDTLASLDPTGTRITVTLGDASASAVLLEETAPLTCAALLRRLPLEGAGTNTIFSGPLVRFWNKDGGPNGETPLEERGQQYEPSLETSPVERTRAGRGLTISGEPYQELLYPGYLYYLPRRPWRGIRIAAGDPTKMGGALVPFAKFVGDWSAFSEVATLLTREGGKDMTFFREV
jgi:hypothetical protein